MPAAHVCLSLCKGWVSGCSGVHSCQKASRQQVGWVSAETGPIPLYLRVQGMTSLTFPQQKLRTSAPSSPSCASGRKCGR